MASVRGHGASIYGEPRVLDSKKRTYGPGGMGGHPARRYIAAWAFVVRRLVILTLQGTRGVGIMLPRMAHRRSIR